MRKALVALAVVGLASATLTVPRASAQWYGSGYGYGYGGYPYPSYGPGWAGYPGYGSVWSPPWGAAGSTPCYSMYGCPYPTGILYGSSNPVFVPFPSYGSYPSAPRTGQVCIYDTIYPPAPGC
jgi:hypothetical protein